MSKGIIVVNMPERCRMCRYMYHTDEGYCFCNVEGYGFDYAVAEYMQSKPNGKPDWCPIKLMPKKMEVCGTYPQPDGITASYKIGWNECIDKILKETKK